MIETARLKQDRDAYKAMFRELVAALNAPDMATVYKARDKAEKMLDNERTVTK